MKLVWIIVLQVFVWTEVSISLLPNSRVAELSTKYIFNFIASYQSDFQSCFYKFGIHSINVWVFLLSHDVVDIRYY